jgi:hypothetical protein
MMTDTKDAALRLALDALEYHTAQTRPITRTEEAMAAIRAALAQPETQGREWWAAVIESAKHGPCLDDSLHTSRDAALTSGSGLYRVIDAVRLA